MFFDKIARAIFKILVLLICIAKFLGIMTLTGYLFWLVWGITIIPYSFTAGAVWGFRVVDRKDEYSLPWLILFLAWGLPMLPSILVWYEDFSKFVGLPTVQTKLAQLPTFWFGILLLALNVLMTIMASKFFEMFFRRLEKVHIWVMEPVKNKGG